MPKLLPIASPSGDWWVKIAMVVAFWIYEKIVFIAICTYFECKGTIKFAHLQISNKKGMMDR